MGFGKSLQILYGKVCHCDDLWSKKAAEKTGLWLNKKKNN